MRLVTYFRNFFCIFPFSLLLWYNSEGQATLNSNEAYHSYIIASADMTNEANVQQVMAVLKSNIEQWSFIEAQILEPNVNLGMPEIFVPLRHLTTTLEALGNMHFLREDNLRARDILERACPLMELLPTLAYNGYDHHAGGSCFDLLKDVYMKMDEIYRPVDINKRISDLRLPYTHFLDDEKHVMGDGVNIRHNSQSAFMAIKSLFLKFVENHDYEDTTGKIQLVEEMRFLLTSLKSSFDIKEDLVFELLDIMTTISEDGLERLSLEQASLLRSKVDGYPELTKEDVDRLEVLNALLCCIKHITPDKKKTCDDCNNIESTSQEHSLIVNILSLETHHDSFVKNVHAVDRSFLQRPCGEDSYARRYLFQFRFSLENDEKHGLYFLILIIVLLVVIYSCNVRSHNIRKRSRVRNRITASTIMTPFWSCTSVFLFFRVDCWRFLHEMSDDQKHNSRGKNFSIIGKDKYLENFCDALIRAFQCCIRVVFSCPKIVHNDCFLTPSAVLHESTMVSSRKTEKAEKKQDEKKLDKKFTLSKGRNLRYVNRVQFKNSNNECSTNRNAHVDSDSDSDPREDGDSNNDVDEDFSGLTRDCRTSSSPSQHDDYIIDFDGFMKVMKHSRSISFFKRKNHAETLRQENFSLSPGEHNMKVPTFNGTNKLKCLSVDYDATKNKTSPSKSMDTYPSFRNQYLQRSHQHEVQQRQGVDSGKTMMVLANCDSACDIKNGNATTAVEEKKSLKNPCMDELHDILSDAANLFVQPENNTIISGVSHYHEDIFSQPMYIPTIGASQSCEFGVDPRAVYSMTSEFSDDSCFLQDSDKWRGFSELEGSSSSVGSNVFIALSQKDEEVNFPELTQSSAQTIQQRESFLRSGHVKDELIDIEVSPSNISTYTSIYQPCQYSWSSSSSVASDVVDTGCAVGGIRREVSLLLTTHFFHHCSSQIDAVKLMFSDNDNVYTMKRSLRSPSLWGLSLKISTNSQYLKYRYLIVNANDSTWIEHRNSRSIYLDCYKSEYEVEDIISSTEMI